MQDEHTKKFNDITQWLSGEYATIRTGQATPALLDSIKVESYGAHLPVQQVGSVGVEDARTLRVTPWDVSQVPAIERAIQDADLGVSVATDSAGLRVIFPELTVERREQLVKLAKQKLEEARVRVKQTRDEAMKSIDAEHKAGDLSDDERYDAKESLQTEVTKCNEALEQLFSQKEQELQK